MVMRRFLPALVHHISKNNQFYDGTYYLAASILMINKLPPKDAENEKGQKQPATMQVHLSDFMSDIIEKWKSLKSTVFFLQYLDHHVVVTMEIGKDSWVANVTSNKVYDAIDMDI